MKALSATSVSNPNTVFEFKQLQYKIVKPCESISVSDNRFSDSEVTTNNALYYDAILQIVDKNYQEFKSRMLVEIKSSFVESGMIYDYEILYDSYIDQYGQFVSALLLSRMLKEFFDNTQIAKGLLHLISHRPYNELGEMMAFQVMSAANHDDKRIKKFALKVIDNWDSVDMLPLLKGTSAIREYWLNDYKNKIIQRLEAKKRDAVLRSSNQSRELA